MIDHREKKCPYRFGLKRRMYDDNGQEIAETEDENCIGMACVMCKGGEKSVHSALCGIVDGTTGRLKDIVVAIEALEKTIKEA